MPKLKKNIDLSRQQSGIMHCLTRQGYELKDFGKMIGQSPNTGYRKYQEPGRLTVADLLLMKASHEEIMDILIK